LRKKEFKERKVIKNEKTEKTEMHRRKVRKELVKKQNE